MKVAMMSAWNADSGASIHAELIGREWIRKGVDLTIFTFYPHSFHGKVFTIDLKEESDCVFRCFTRYGDPHPRVDISLMLDKIFDIFIVQDLGMLPMEKMLEFFGEINKRSKTVNVIHDGALSKKPEFFKFKWDAVVSFDERYRNFLKDAYPSEKLKMIPYPFSPFAVGDKEAARKKLNLPLQKKIIFVFGQAAQYITGITPILEELQQQYDVALVVVTKIKMVLNKFKAIKDWAGFDTIIVEKVLDMKELYDYLHAADCLVFNKASMPVVVVSSTIAQCLGSTCPIVARDSSFVYSLNGEVIKYKNLNELKSSIIDVFEQGEKYQQQQVSIKDYLENHSAEYVSEEFLTLFKNLIQ
ncbi:MAG: glycosyltransferase [Candidatus Omnitrophica bacterium]|nr:glycosyltransferase [Candidatus Omnitrophota bacterium]